MPDSKCRLCALLVCSVTCAPAANRTATLLVSAKVNPKARLTVISALQVSAAVAAYPGSIVTVWADGGSCIPTTTGHLVSSAGITPVTFTAAEVKGMKKFCLGSSDGSVKDSVSIPKK